MELSSLVNRLGSTLSTSVLSFKLIALILLRNFNFTKKISLISMYMYYVKTRADNSGYAHHRIICFVVNGSSFDSEQVFQVSNGYL
jgi:hypothetical protein